MPKAEVYRSLLHLSANAGNELADEWQHYVIKYCLCPEINTMYGAYFF